MTVLLENLILELFIISSPLGHHGANGAHSHPAGALSFPTSLLGRMGYVTKFRTISCEWKWFRQPLGGVLRGRACAGLLPSPLLLTGIWTWQWAIRDHENEWWSKRIKGVWMLGSSHSVVCVPVLECPSPDCNVKEKQNYITAVSHSYWRFSSHATESIT